jgi:hypothetical protein
MPRPTTSSRAFAYRLERHVPVHPWDWSFSQPDRRGHRCGELLKRRSPEEVRDHGDHWSPRPARRVERDLVDVLDEHVEGPPVEGAAVRAARLEGKRPAGAHADHLHPIERHVWCAAAPTTTQQHHLVTARREAAENLVQVCFGAASLRVVPVLPVDDQNPQVRVSPGAGRGRQARR